MNNNNENNDKSSGRLFTKSYRPTKTPELKPMPKDVEEFASSLEKKGHTCIMYNGYCKEPYITWCKKDVCTTAADRDKMFKFHDEQNALFYKLKNEGHTCVGMLPGCPSRVEWCEQHICVNKPIENKKSWFRRVINMFF